MAFFKKRKPDFFLILLILVAVLVCYTNYTPNTYLSGWDTLHPEFNFSQYLTRITSVWQEHQGLGAPPSQAHASELPRMVIYKLLMLTFPKDFVRHSYFFLMIILGPVGVYFFLLSQFRKEDKLSDIPRLSAFLGGLFYLLNLATVQHFIVPFEMFATKFGFLGFIYLFATKFIDQKKKNDLIIFLLLVIFSSSMAHTVTLWYIFFIGLAIYLFTYSLILPAKGKLKRSLILLSLTLFVNLCWILPNFYYSFNYGKDVINSKIHRLFSEEAYLNSKDYGNLTDLLIFKNFLFNWRVPLPSTVIKNSKMTFLFTDLLRDWKRHLDYYSIRLIGYLLSILAIFGWRLSVTKKKAVIISLTPTFLITSFLLLLNIPFLSSLFDFLREKNQFFGEVFRFPFTKLSIYLTFCLASFFAYFNYFFLKKISRVFNQYLFSSFYFCFLTFLIIIFALPAFGGNFISPIVRAKIPKEYFDLFAWFEKQENGRILSLPLQSLYGWSFYQWDNSSPSQLYEGAGFLWFGLKQPLLNREFDRWYPYNEQNYREFFYAVYSQNQNLFEKLLKKYNVKFILLDENIINPGTENDKLKLFYPQIKDLLKSTGNIRLIKEFGSKISVYQYQKDNVNQEIYLLKQGKEIQPAFKWNYLDQAYIENGDYFSSVDPTKSDNALIYPFRNLLNEKERVKKDLIKTTNSYAEIKPSLDYQKGEVWLPDLQEAESRVIANLFIREKNQQRKLILKYLIPYPKNSKGYSQELLLPDNNGLIISVNKRTFQIPEKLTVDLLYLGETLVEPKKGMEIIIYDSGQGQATDFKLPKVNPYVCSSDGKAQGFGNNIWQDGFNLNVLSGKVCQEFPLSEILPKTEMESVGAFNIKFSYRATKNSRGELCFYDKMENRCLSRRLLDSQDSQENIFTDYLYFNKEELDQLFLRFSLESLTSTAMQGLTVNSLQLFSMEESKKLTLPVILSEYFNNQAFANFKIDFAKKTEPEIQEFLHQKGTNCGLKKAKNLNKKLISENGVDILEYQTERGTLCDSLVLPYLSGKVGYLLEIESKNTRGLPLRICFEDTGTKMCVLEDELSKFKKFESDYFLIPAYGHSGGYNLIFTNLSIGDIASINQLKGIRITPFPYNFLQAIKVGDKGKNSDLNSRREAVSFIKKTPYLYKVILKGKLTGNELLVLNQAYEKGWVAWQGIPFFGKKLEHVFVNNWANGWEIKLRTKNLELKTTTQNLKSDNLENNSTIQQYHNSTVYILFWPQLLEFLGFGLLVLLPFGLAHFSACTN